MFIREQPRTITEDEQELLWWIPIAYLSPENMDLNSVLPIAWMRGEKYLNITYLPDENSFIIVNPTDSGITNFYLYKCQNNKMTGKVKSNT